MAAGHARIDLDAQTVTYGDAASSFEIDPEIKRRLLNGLDDIGVTLELRRHDRGLRARAGAGRAQSPTCDERPATGTRAATTASPRRRWRWRARCSSRLPLEGDETVLDAGCGSGRVTELLLERLPDGGVMAVDAAPSMVEQARERFAGEPRVTVLQPGPRRARARRAGRRRLLERRLPLDPGSRRPVRAPARRAAARRAARGPVRREGQHRRASAASPTRWPQSRPTRRTWRLRGALELRRPGGDRGAAAARRLRGGRAAGSSPGR